MIDSIKNIFSIPDLRKRVIFTFLMLAVYRVGGHIPVEVVNRLLSEKPQITGINLPGMPEGTPGMPGNKPDALKIYEIGKGPPKVYAVV